MIRRTLLPPSCLVLLLLLLAVARPLPVAGQAAAARKQPAAPSGRMAPPAPVAGRTIELTQPASLVPAAPRTGPPVLIRGATVLTVTKGTIPNGMILLRDGRIAAVGTNLPLPPDAEVVDATGRFILPGIIDQHSHIAESATNENGTTVSSMVRIEDVIAPGDVNIYRELAGGTTAANILHGSANPIGGTSSVIKLRWGVKRAEELVFDAAVPGQKFGLGENAKQHPERLGGTPLQRYPATRPGVEYTIRDAFTRAKAYQKQWQDYERRRKAHEDVLPPRRDLQLDPLVEILEGRRFAHVHAYRADEILMMIRLAEEFGFKVRTFDHGLEGYKVAKEIAAHGAGVGTFADWWGFKVEANDAIPYNAALLIKAGVIVSINSDSAEHGRRLNLEAAKMIKWGGLTEQQALELVTINPAKQLGLDRRIGSIEVGKDADLVIWSAHPLSSYATVERAYIDGVLYYEREADLRRVAEVDRRKQALVAAERGGTNQPATASPAAATPPPALPPAGAAYQPDQGPRPVAITPKGLLAIVNAKIVPVTRPVIDNGTILIRDGRIEAVGASLAVPDGAKVIDARGAEVYPGWINAKTTTGLTEPGPAGFQDTADLHDYNPQLRTVVAYHNDSDAIPVTRANGITTVAVMPSGGILGGEVPVMNLDGWTWEESLVRRAAGVSFQFPGLTRAGAPGPAADAGTESDYGARRRARDQQLDRLATLFDQARAYAKAAGPDRERDWVLEALVPVVERQLPLFTTVQREQDIVDAIAFAERTRVRIVICAGPEAALVAPLLKAKDIPVILGPVLTLPSREDMFHAASYMAAGQLAKAGVRFAFATNDSNYARLLPYHAARAVAWGLPREEALRALTITAAEILGVADRLGSIEPGKVANLLVANGDALEARTEVTHVIINGVDVDLANKQQALYERYANRK